MQTGMPPKHKFITKNAVSVLQNHARQIAALMRNDPPDAVFNHQKNSLVELINKDIEPSRRKALLTVVNSGTLIGMVDSNAKEAAMQQYIAAAAAAAAAAQPAAAAAAQPAAAAGPPPAVAARPAAAAVKPRPQPTATGAMQNRKKRHKKQDDEEQRLAGESDDYGGGYYEERKHRLPRRVKTAYASLYKRYGRTPKADRNARVVEHMQNSDPDGASLLEWALGPLDADEPVGLVGPLAPVPLRAGRNGRTGAIRHRKILRDNIQGVTKPAIRRLARRAGVKRLSGMIYEETRGVLKVFLERVIRDAVVYCEHSRRKTVTTMDVVYAAKRQGRTLYGFGG